ncbi:MAG: class I SAM-dependent methyltransferase [Candidatus Rokubacteria bacterium]|nr:class I SAM-dependent methyltransferase [Candidatus Rokubacteria bacterium]
MTRAASCPLCGSGTPPRWLGIRGNREHANADPDATPHLWTNVVRCRACDYFYTCPEIAEGPALERAYYDDPERYAAFAPASAPAVVRARLAWIERVCGRGSLLDVGAGKGEFVHEAIRSGWRAAGIEPSPRFCAHARKRLGVELRCGSLEDVAALDEGPFDVATLSHVLEHVERPIDFLRAVARHLTPGGRLFVEVPNCDALLLRAADVYFRLRRRAWSSRLSPLHPPFHRFGFSTRSLRFALARAGFRVVAVRTFAGADRGTGHRLMPGAQRLASRALAVLPSRELLGMIAERAPERAQASPSCS